LLFDGIKKQFRILSTIHSGQVTLMLYTSDTSRNSKTYFTEQLQSYMKDKGYSFSAGQSPLKKYFNLSDPFDNLILRLGLPWKSYFPPFLWSFYNTDSRKGSVSPHVVFGIVNEPEIIKCNEELFVYADMESAVNVEFEYLSRNYPWIQFYKGKESILHGNAGWHFSSQGNPLVLNTFKTFVSSGIYSKLYEIYVRKLYSVRVYNTRKQTANNEWNRVEPVKLSGSILTLFLIYGILLALLIALGMVEIRSELCNLARACFMAIYKCVLTCLRIFHDAGLMWKHFKGVSCKKKNRLR